MVTNESPLKYLFRPEEIELLICGSRVRKPKCAAKELILFFNPKETIRSSYKMSYIYRI